MMIWTLNSLACINTMMISNNNMVFSKMTKTNKMQSLLIILSTLLMISIMMQESNKGPKKSKFMYLSFAAMSIMLMMIFTTNSILWFFVFFESAMVPIFVVIMVWGSNPEKMQASFYMMIYTLLASLPFLFSISMMFKKSKMKTMEMSEITKTTTNYTWTGLILIFMVKMPCFLLHLWLPKAHVEAPAPGSMMLAGVLLKLGSYGLTKFIPMVYFKINKISKVLMTLGMVGAMVMSISCTRQTDLKIMIAFSSVAHMSTVTAAIMTTSKMGLKSSFLLMVSHGLCSSAMFFTMNIMYKNTMTRNTQLMKGFINYQPSIMINWFMVCAFNMAAPPSINYSSEIAMFTSIMSATSVTAYLIPANSMMVGIYCVFMFTMTSHGANSSINKNEIKTIDLMNQSMMTIMLMNMFVSLKYL